MDEGERGKFCEANLAAVSALEPALSIRADTAIRLDELKIPIGGRAVGGMSDSPCRHHGGTIEMMTLHDLTVRDRAICGGQPVFRGSRVTLRSVLASLADGDSVEEILASFPTLREDQVRAAIAFAAASAQDDLPLPELPSIA